MDYIYWFAILLLIVFLGYTAYVVRTESFWKSLKIIMTYRWGRQVVMDLYVGLLLFGFVVYLNEGSILTTLAWVTPALVLGNPISLIYFILNFESLVAHFN